MIHIITDSTCDLSAARASQLGVEVAPLSVHFGHETFRDGVDITNAEFYGRLRAAQELPTTAQVNPEDFIARFQKVVDQGDQVVGIFLSSLLSGTCQSAGIARGIVDEENIFVVDSGTVTFALGLLVEQAAQMRDQGLEAGEIARRVEALAKRLRFYAVVDTLKYLKMGGRISSATALVGGMLGITPILNIRDGVVEAAGKSRGRKGAFAWMEEKVNAEPADLSLPVAFGHSDAPAVMEEIEGFFLERLPGAQVRESDIGAVVGTHAGPGCAGIAYFVKE